MSERWFEGLYMGTRFHTNEGVVMRLSDATGTRDVPWDPTGVVRARAEGGHHEDEHVIPSQISSED